MLVTTVLNQFTDAAKENARDRALAELPAGAIAWTLSAVVRLENLDIAVLDDREVRLYAELLQRELRAVRLTMHAAVRALAAAQDERGKMARTLEELRHTKNGPARIASSRSGLSATAEGTCRTPATNVSSDSASRRGHGKNEVAEGDER